ncbi:MAG: alpha/beta hydrolase family esterase [Kofleriaceae bacterium]
MRRHVDCLVIALIVAACSGGGGAIDAPAIDAAPPVASGCIDDVTSGDRVYMCDGLRVDARIPAACQAPGCGLILVLHGDTGTGVLMDAHVRMREIGAAANYIVVAPTGPPFGSGYPGSTWRVAQDASLVAMVEMIRDVFRVDPAKIHVTGFSRGSFVTWRLLCDHADLFASVAPAGGGDGAGFGEVTCFSNGRVPSRKAPILFLMGRTDTSVGYATLAQIRDAAIAHYGATGPTTIASDAQYRHDRWTGDAIVETFDHAYETVTNGPFGSARGHCIPGSTTDPYAQQYAIPCVLPNAFVWGDEVLAFFRAHPK